MGLIVNKTDFTGRFALSKSIQDTTDDYIDRYEEKYLIQLLGAELFTQFKASFVTNLPTGDYLILYNKIAIDSCDGLKYSSGMKNMMLGFIWWEYVIGTKYKATGTGIVVDSNEVSRNADFSEGFIYKLYNESVKDYQTIQWYAIENTDKYPKFNGIHKRLNWMM